MSQLVVIFSKCKLDQQCMQRVFQFINSLLFLTFCRAKQNRTLKTAPNSPFDGSVGVQLASTGSAQVAGGVMSAIEPLHKSAHVVWQFGHPMKEERRAEKNSLNPVL